MIGTLIAEVYEVKAEIGRGGMGVVYLAFDHQLGRDVAIKVLKTELKDDPGRLTSFRQEANTLAKLDNPAITKIYSLIQDQGQWYMIMEYVDGPNFYQLITQLGAMQVPSALPLFLQVLAGVDYAHSRRVIHRDIKPGNLMVTSEGAAKIMDFGIARHLDRERQTKDGTFKGTFEYASPEQLRGIALDGRSDIYSLGVVLFEMLTGQVPFTGTDYEILDGHINKNPPSPRNFVRDLAKPIEKAILKALEKKPDDRFQSAGEFRQALEAALVVDQEKGKKRSPFSAIFGTGHAGRTSAPAQPPSRSPVPTPQPPPSRPPTPAPPVPAPPVPAPVVMSPPAATAPPVPAPIVTPPPADASPLPVVQPVPVNPASSAQSAPEQHALPVSFAEPVSPVAPPLASADPFFGAPVEPPGFAPAIQPTPTDIAQPAPTAPVIAALRDISAPSSSPVPEAHSQPDTPSIAASAPLPIATPMPVAEPDPFFDAPPESPGFAPIVQPAPVIPVSPESTPPSAPQVVQSSRPQPPAHAGPEPVPGEPEAIYDSVPTTSSAPKSPVVVAGPEPIAPPAVRTETPPIETTPLSVAAAPQAAADPPKAHVAAPETSVVSAPSARPSPTPAKPVAQSGKKADVAPSRSSNTGVPAAAARQKDKAPPAGETVEATHAALPVHKSKPPMAAIVAVIAVIGALAVAVPMLNKHGGGKSDAPVTNSGSQSPNTSGNGTGQSKPDVTPRDPDNGTPTNSGRNNAQNSGQPQKPAGKVCKKCGKANKPNALFCEFCGSKM